MPVRVEQGVEIRDVKFKQLPGRLNVAGPNGHLVGMDFPASPRVETEKQSWPSGRIPSKHEFKEIRRPEEMEQLIEYRDISQRELLMMLGVRGSQRSEGYSDDTQASSNSYELATAEALRGSEFRVATEDMLGKEFKIWELQQEVRKSGVGIGEDNEPERNNKILYVKAMEEAVEVIDKELREGPQG